jgi:NAD(H)-dependent 7beta-hydroxy-3-oxo-delta4-cholenoic acid oxidoreductase
VNNTFARLFSPIKIGTMELKNRIALAPMDTDYVNQDGTLSERYHDYIEARAKGGAGLLILEVTSIDGKYPYVPHTVGMWDDSQIGPMRRLTDAIHAHGSRLIPQIAHPGPESVSFLYKVQPVGPSPAMCFTHKTTCRELSVEEIAHIVEQFGDSARRARESGCDGIELHSAHCYMLLGSFISALRNKRSDAYGGSIESRLRIHLEVLRNIQAKAGRDFPIVMRLSGDELTPGGRDIEETKYIAPMLVEAGVHAFHISSGTFPQMSWRILPPHGTPMGLNVPYAAAVKEAVKVPVFTVGRITDPRLAESILERGQADVIVLGRALLADPEWPNKAATGQLDDITPCIGCGLGCIHGREHHPMTCLMNPSVGREKEMGLVPAAKPKKVMVIGGGPGGMHAAMVAAQRGHQVTICEKQDRLGGQFNLAVIPPGKQELTKATQFLARQAEKAGAKVRLNTEVTTTMVEQEKPDVAIVATGGEALVLNIPGVKGKNVVTAHDVLSGKVRRPYGDVLIIGGGMVGLETAEFLAHPGYNPIVGRTSVTVIEMLGNVGMDMVPEGRTLLMERLHEAQVRIITNRKVREILQDGVVVINTIVETKPDRTVVCKEGDKEEAIRGMKTIVLAMGAKSVDVLSAELKGKVPEVYVIGDAKKPRKALEAIAEAAEVARKI